jgi:hypothetical protein
MTIVIRDTPSRSVRPTVNDAMLKPAASNQRRHARQHARLVLDVNDEGGLH